MPALVVEFRDNARLPLLFGDHDRNLARIEQELGEFVTALSYPVGSRQAFNTDTRTALQNNDFDWAFSYYGGFLNRSAVGASEPFDRLDIPRVAIESDTSLNEVRSICSLPQIFARH